MVACCLIGDEVNRLISAMNSLAFKTFVLKIFGRMHAQLYVMFDGFGGKVFGLGKNMLVLTTIGRRTGQARSTALLQWQDGERVYVVGSFLGNDRAPFWCLNLSANPTAQIQIGGTKRPYRARFLEDSERSRIWREMLQLYPGYSNYERRTRREIPVIEFAPVPGSDRQ
jgi:deazaflavin-dependent oxidoreductase (nitroreductase family)